MACISNDPEESNVPENAEQNGEEAAKGKMLVIYFSRAGAHLATPCKILSQVGALLTTPCSKPVADLRALFYTV